MIAQRRCDNESKLVTALGANKLIATAPGRGRRELFFFFFSGGGEAGWGRQGRTCVCAISHEAKRDSRKLKRKQDGGREAVVLKEREYV